MVPKNSGKIYAIKLDFDLGYALCKQIDYTDISSFDGLVVYILEERFSALPEITNVEIKKMKPLYGPVALNKRPNIKGKGSWVLLDQLNETYDVPVFKDTNQLITLYHALDWSKVGGWHKRYNFHESGEFCIYEEVRNLEMLTLYDMDAVRIRTTMHFLLLNGSRVGAYYNLSDEKNRRLFVQMLNTSFDKKTLKGSLRLEMLE